MPVFTLTDVWITHLQAWEYGHHCRANMARLRQSRPDSGIGSQVKGLNIAEVVSTRSDLTECIHKLIFDSQPPPRLVN